MSNFKNFIITLATSVGIGAGLGYLITAVPLLFSADGLGSVSGSLRTVHGALIGAGIACLLTVICYSHVYRLVRFILSLFKIGKSIKEHMQKH